LGHQTLLTYKIIDYNKPYSIVLDNNEKRDYIIEAVKERERTEV